MPQYLDNLQGTIPHAMGFPDTNNCPECDDATEIMLERCPAKSIAFALTSQSVSFSKEGKIIISDEYFDKLRQFSADGKITPGNYRKTRRKEGIRKIYYDAQKHDMVEHHYEDKCTPDQRRRMSEFANQFAMLMDDYFIQSHLCGTASTNVGCVDCTGIFDDIGTLDAPKCIDIPAKTEFGTSAMQVAADQFLQYLVGMKAYGDNLPDACDNKMYIVLNSCFAPLMTYLKFSKQASCDSTCALDRMIRPMTSDTDMLPDVYFSKRVPLNDVDGVKSSPVLAGYYDDDVLVPEPVFGMSSSGKHTAMWDYRFYSFQYANIRPDRKWQGSLKLNFGGA